METKLTEPQRRLLMAVVTLGPPGVVCGAQKMRTVDALRQRGLVDGGYIAPTIVTPTTAGRIYVSQHASL